MPPPTGSGWPRITIVTPSLNQGKFIEETIRSVLLQKYPDLEYIVVDGGSTDESVGIIRQYEPWVSHWVSEADRGQAHAINKGLQRATGEIVAYLNSDDLYLPGALVRVARHFRASPTTTWVSGTCVVLSESGERRLWPTTEFHPNLADWVYDECIPPQQSMFWRRQIFDHYGYFDEAMNFAFDSEFCVRIVAAGERYERLDDALGVFRHHAASKTISQSLEFEADHDEIVRRHPLALSERELSAYVTRMRRRQARFRLFESRRLALLRRRRQAVGLWMASIRLHPGALLSRHSLGAVRRIIAPGADARREG